MTTKRIPDDLNASVATGAKQHGKTGRSFNQGGRWQRKLIMPRTARIFIIWRTSAMPSSSPAARRCRGEKCVVILKRELLEKVLHAERLKRAPPKTGQNAVNVPRSLESHLFVDDNGHWVTSIPFPDECSLLKV